MMRRRQDACGRAEQNAALPEKAPFGFMNEVTPTAWHDGTQQNHSADAHNCNVKKNTPHYKAAENSALLQTYILRL